MSLTPFHDPSLVLLVSGNPGALEQRVTDVMASNREYQDWTMIVSQRQELMRAGSLPLEPQLVREADRMLAALIATRLSNNRPTIVVCGPGQRERGQLLQLATKAGVPCHLVLVDGVGPERKPLQRDLAALRTKIEDGGALGDGYHSADAISADELGEIRFDSLHLSEIDVVGDVHGCYDELVTLLTDLGYRKLDAGKPYHPKRRIVSFVGDLVNGPKSVEVVLLVDRLVRAGCARIGALGNHDLRLLRGLILRKTPASHGNVIEMMQEFQEAGKEAVDAVRRLFLHAPSHSVYDEGRLIITHGALRPKNQGIRPTSERDDETSEQSLYGQRSSETDERNVLKRSHNWIEEWPADGPTVIFGHDIVGETPVRFGKGNRIIGVDCGCKYGGALAAVRWPSKHIIMVESQQPKTEELTIDLKAA